MCIRDSPKTLPAFHHSCTCSFSPATVSSYSSHHSWPLAMVALISRGWCELGSQTNGAECQDKEGCMRDCPGEKHLSVKGRDWTLQMVVSYTSLSATSCFKQGFARRTRITPLIPLPALRSPFVMFTMNLSGATQKSLVPYENQKCSEWCQSNG